MTALMLTHSSPLAPREESVCTDRLSVPLTLSSRGARGLLWCGLVGVRDTTFAVLWLFIAFVSVWDSYLTLTFRHQMQSAELNPVGRALIELNGGDVHYLLAAKLLGTTAALAWLMLLYECRRRRGMVIAAGVACFQLALLLFLTFA